ncbi:MAG: hypothetical protein OI715_00470 (plasmid) [Candidatus Methanoperedens sp.]|nr:MAG: hypothetical protein OI715_00470 [Candidatus Methanoperedens sp.]
MMSEYKDASENKNKKLAVSLYGVMGDWLLLLFLFEYPTLNHVGS